MRTFLVAVFAFMMSATAQAADFWVSTNAEDQTVVVMYGETMRGDTQRMMVALEEAKNTSYTETVDLVAEDGEVIGQQEVERVREFSNEIWLSGPGGDMFAGIEMAWTVRAQGLNTVALEDCASACGLIFTAGVERRLFDYKARVGFHMPTSHTFSAMNELKEAQGWLGVQDYKNATAAFFLTYLIYFGLDYDYIVLFEMSQIENSRDLFWVDFQNFNLIGKEGRVH